MSIPAATISIKPAYIPPTIPIFPIPVSVSEDNVFGKEAIYQLITIYELCDAPPSSYYFS